MIRQTDPALNKYIQKYGCYFMSLAFHTGKNFTAEELNKIWDMCIEKGYISGDLNKDGDFDDSGEAIILNPNGVCLLLGLKYRYVGKHNLGTDKIIPGYIAVGCFFNKRTNFRHFVAINRYKTVIFDPIPNSVTVREGIMESMRLFYPA